MALVCAHGHRQLLRVLLGLVLLVARSSGQDLYLYKRGIISPILGARGMLEAEHSGITSVRAALAEASDDGLVDTFPLNFSFPYYGNPRVRELSVDANGGLRLAPFAPDEYVCKNILTSYFCLVPGGDSSVLGAYVTDLWPGDPLAAGQPVGGGIFAWQDPARRAFSVLWADRKYFRPSLLSVDAAAVTAIDVTVAVTVRSDGRVRFMWQEIGATASLNFAGRGVFAGLRATRFMSTAPLVARQSANDLRLQTSWLDLVSAPVETVGAFVDAAHAVQGATAELCMVPDVDLNSLLPQSLCAADPNVTGGGAALELVVPDALLGCVRAGIELRCQFGVNTSEVVVDDGNGTNTTLQLVDYAYTAATDLGVGLLGCALPPPPFSWGAFNTSLFGLVFVNVDSLQGGNRSVNVGICGAVGGPTMDFNASCPLDALGEPDVRDCAGACGGGATRDRNGDCCAGGVDCSGRCLPSGGAGPAERVPAILRALQGPVTVPTTQLVCCLAQQVDCDGVCQGCSCAECACPLPLPADRAYCPSAAASPTPRPTPSSDAQGGSGLSSPFQLPTIFLFIIGVLIASSVIRVARFYFFADNSPDWLAMARAMGAGAGAEKPHLTAEEIAAHTELVVLRDGEVFPHVDPVHDEDGGDDDDNDEDGEGDIEGRSPGSQRSRDSGRRRTDASASGAAAGAAAVVAVTSAAGRRRSRRAAELQRGPSAAELQRGPSAAELQRGPSAASLGVPVVSVAVGGDAEAPGDVETQHGLCAICICEFENEEVLRKLPCGHFFHRDCVDEWFERSTLCPMCKQDVRGAIDPSEDI